MKRALFIALAAIGLLAVAGVFVYTFGTPEAPEAPETVVAEEAAAAPAAGEGRLIPPDPDVPLAVQIPGCKCHSKDEKVVREHAKYRMNQCAGCHAGATPTGAR